MENQNPNNILTLFKNPEDRDLILSRLNKLSDLFNELDDDSFLEMAHYKILEAIDWYSRYCDGCGYYESDDQEEVP